MGWGTLNRFESSRIDQTTFLERQTLSLTRFDPCSATDARWNTVRNKGACLRSFLVILNRSGLTALGSVAVSGCSRVARCEVSASYRTRIACSSIAYVATDIFQASDPIQMPFRYTDINVTVEWFAINRSHVSSSFLGWDETESTWYVGH
jgi:hypothetical protein